MKLYANIYTYNLDCVGSLDVTTFNGFSEFAEYIALNGYYVVIDIKPHKDKTSVESCCFISAVKNYSKNH